MPDLSALLDNREHKGWFGVPGMHGGFAYWFDDRSAQPTLVVESWCRVVDGSGQRHEVTVAGARLVDDGFV